MINNPNDIIVGTPESNKWRYDLLEKEIKDVDNLNDSIYLLSLKQWIEKYLQGDNNVKV